MSKFFALGFCVIFLSCTATKQQNTNFRASEVTFSSFVSTDLSEDQSNLSTQSDEIVVVYGLIFCDSNNKIISNLLLKNFESTVTRNTKYYINQSVSILPNNLKPIILIGLLEIDVEMDQEAFLKNFQKQISFQKIETISQLWDTQIKYSCPDNDNLGIILMRPEQGKQNFRIGGNHLSDHFEYFFETSIE